MKLQTRKHLLQLSAGLSVTCNLPIQAIEPINRPQARIKGLSLAAYSLRSQMMWFKGKKGNGKMDMLQFLDYTAKEGFDAAELTAYFFPEPVTKPYLNEVKRRAHILGLDLSSGAIGNNFSMKPGSQEAIQQSQYVKKWINHYADMGIPVIRVFAGKKGPKGASESDISNYITHNLNEALEHAEKRGVMLGMENHDSMTRVDKLVSFTKTVQSSYFGVTWDSANITTEGDPYKELEKIAPYCINAQVKVMIPYKGKRVPTDLPKIVSILKKANYAGYIVLEYEEAEDPFISIPKYKKALDQLI